MLRVLPFCLVIALAACSREPAAENTEETTPPPTAATTPPSAFPVAPLGTDPTLSVLPVPVLLPDVIARVNGEAIERAEIEQAIREVEGRAGEPVPADQRNVVYRGVLDQLIAYRLLVQESRARRVTVAEAELDARMADIREQFPSEDVFRQSLVERKMTLTALREEAREGLQIDKMLEAELADAVAVTPAEVEEFYRNNPSQFQLAERVRASHIFVSVPETADGTTREAARAWAAEILKAVRAGNDFATIARERSNDTASAPNGGDLGFIERGQMVGPFEEAAFSLQPGEISDLVETPLGYHIIRVAEKHPPRALPLDEIRPQLKEFLEAQNRGQYADAFVAALRARSQVDIFM